MRECRVSDAEAQRNSLSEAAATQADDTPRATKGTPDSAGRAGHECALHAISVLRDHFRWFLGRSEPASHPLNSPPSRLLGRPLTSGWLDVPSGASLVVMISSVAGTGPGPGQREGVSRGFHTRRRLDHPFEDAGLIAGEQEYRRRRGTAVQRSSAAPSVARD